ncbi:MAG TPA: proton-conducting transporter membrane subunit [Planctomycetota bacterium]|nr:proton-conducting transporter membrane subunit [Planctomycetota bacterium]
MVIFLIAMGLMALGGLAAMAAGRSARAATALGAGSAAAGSALGLCAALSVLLEGGSRALAGAPRWSMPGGALSLELDALSAFFLLPTLLLSGLAAIYGAEYLLAFRGRKNLGTAWFCFNALVVSMALVLTARNAILFLLAWETMALSSFFLVAFESEKPETRRAAWIYMVATHLGTACLLAMFVLMAARSGGSFEFGAMGALAGLSPAFAGLIFVLALVGFGTKAGFMPLHVWLPEAHPAAPSHVSAVMSGVMIKTGIYGLVRILAMLGHPPAWWGWTLVAIGATSGILGVLFALAQHDIKRLLAYHSVENIGIIALGLGLGLLGTSLGLPALAVLGFAGGLLHVLNHALFKGLLFLGAGSVLHGTGTREIDHLGGLMKRMPSTGIAFLVGAAAISGLPPLNGFVSEFLIYLGSFRTAAGGTGGWAAAVPAIATIAALALIGGLAAACFAKAFGIIFLGEPRSRHAEGAHEAGAAMRLPMLTLAALCVLIGLCPLPVVGLMGPMVGPLAGLSGPAAERALAGGSGPLAMLTVGAALLLALLGMLVLLRRWLLAGRPVEETVTWDCGYARPTARMQYTASSFAQPLTAVFGIFLRTREKLRAPEGLFPSGAELSTDTPDACERGLFRPAFTGLAWLFGRLRVLQGGRVQIYVLYVVLTLLAILVWKLG